MRLLVTMAPNFQTEILNLTLILVPYKMMAPTQTRKYANE